MVRQYKIHTNLDGTDDKIWDVTNGKVRFYQPSNLGLQSTNNIWQSNGVGVMGTRSITQPQIEFKLETFGESLEENYQLMKDFINDILNQKIVTLEYQTEIFQVYADLALADVTKTEGYGKNGTFSEKITFDIITKWYTYENLTFDKIQNGKVIAGKSKIYGGYKGSETALQNYKRLKESPSLNLPNLNLLEGSKKYTKYNPKTISSSSWDGYVMLYDVFVKNLKAGTYTMSGKSDAPLVAHETTNTNRQGKVGLWLMSTTPGLDVYINLGDTVPKTIEVPKDGDYCVRVNTYSNGTDVVTHSFWDLKLEPGSTATPYMPSASELATADISEYFGYNYIANQAYTYYGETNIERLSRWDIKEEIFSFVGILYQNLPRIPTGVRFLDTIGNEYTAIVFNTAEPQSYILINTDVNDEIYQGWNGTIPLNLFPLLDFERYRTRIIKEGQMELINLTKAEFKIKRKADFV
ncbi:distal tail protein [Lactococcus phage 63302]|uniref:Distal tail protein n=1 Tax=Lactococcus phage 63302 TaxID=2029670 RepID=A0A343JQ85_9CAUD|nr:tail protein [Lactococcus phage 63302]ASZ71658.1 distal tail protein [Lactococcus phage 63302]